MVMSGAYVVGRSFRRRPGCMHRLNVAGDPACGAPTPTGSVSFVSEPIKAILCRNPQCGGKADS